MAHFVVGLLVLILLWVGVTPEEAADDGWIVNFQKGVMKGQSLKISFLEHPTNPFHSCYRVICAGSHCTKDHGVATYDFCYPAIIITGLPKCGTSAMYELLAKFPGALLAQEKENCPYTRRRAHFLYFLSWPSFDSIKPHNLLIDGCIDVINNMKMRDILHHPPKTYYIVMIRDYADMLWSSYNFWCKPAYDLAFGCPYEKWAQKGIHIRTPDIFHELIVADKIHNTSVIQPFYYPMHRPCINAGGYYSEYVDFHVLKKVPANHTIVIASEELDIAPQAVAYRVAHMINYDITGMSLGNFTKIRINTQENKGGHSSVSLQKYIPGVYNISDYQPMRNDTRVLLNECWRDDCLTIAQRTGYNYTACHPATTHAVVPHRVMVDKNHLPTTTSSVDKYINELVIEQAQNRLQLDLTISDL